MDSLTVEKPDKPEKKKKPRSLEIKGLSSKLAQFRDGSPTVCL